MQICTCYICGEDGDKNGYLVTHPHDSFCISVVTTLVQMINRCKAWQIGSSIDAKTTQHFYMYAVDCLHIVYE